MLNLKHPPTRLPEKLRKEREGKRDGLIWS